VILDCTLRDGGYYLDWDFDEEIVRKYLTAIGIANVDIVEVGFRFFPKNRFLGAFAYCDDEFLNSLNLPSNIKVAVMINAADLISYSDGIVQAVLSLFSEKNKSPVDIVRIAVHKKDITDSLIIAKTLSNLGYKVFLNLMRVDKIEPAGLIEIGVEVKNWECIEVLYFADSFGNMDSESVVDTVQSIKYGWEGAIGFHSHDNKGLALSNCLACLKHGVGYLDSTLRGMGRGAGNVKTESLMVELARLGDHHYFADALFPLVIQEFELLYNKYQWGHNIYYHLSAVHGIHPTYIQELLGGGIYESEEILSAIQFLRSNSASFYSLETMLTSISGKKGVMNGGWSASEWVEGREIMIVGTGPSTQRHISAILRYIEKKDPVVLCLNISDMLPKDVVTAYVACHETRILVEADRYTMVDKPIIMPKSRLITPIRNSLKDVQIFDYGLCVDDGGLVVTDHGCTISKPLAGLYAIAVAIATNATKILLVGMDGYQENDYRQKEMVSMFKEFEKYEVPLIAITPTNYPVIKRSIYETDL